MLKTGICSITFRQFNAEQIADIVRKAGLDAIEWGGDIHVPPGDITAAQAARQITQDAGLRVSSYGSYYKVLDKDGNPEAFAPVLESALALGTDTIRVWPGARSSETAGEEYRKKFIEQLRADLDTAAAHGVRLATEFHVSSFTDSNAAALALLKDVNHPNLYTYWQPIYWLADAEYRFQGLEKLCGRVLNLHVFNWEFHPYRGKWQENVERRPLSEGAAEWKRFLSVPLAEGEHFALFEFVRDNSPEQFLQDAATLKSWLAR